MAHLHNYSNNVVTNVIVVSDDDTSDISGVESEAIGIASVNKSLVPILMEETYNGSIEKLCRYWIYLYENVTWCWFY